jgi:PPOX class probable F420-dependent enzyme
MGVGARSRSSMRATDRSGVVDRVQLDRVCPPTGLAVIATRGPDGVPQAALVGITATDRGELVFDTAVKSRKLRNLRAFPRVAVVIGWDDEVTLQCEGDADVLIGQERERCLYAYVQQYPDGEQRAEDPQIVVVRIRPGARPAGSQ